MEQLRLQITEIHKIEEKLYHMGLGGKNILFSAEIDHPNYLKLNFHFPYSEISADFFDENADFLKNGAEEKLLSMVENIVTTLKTVHQKFRELSEKERLEVLEKDDIADQIAAVLDKDCIAYCKFFWGRTLKESLQKKVKQYLNSGAERILKFSEFEFADLYKELLYEYRDCRSLNYYLPQKIKNFWLRKLEKDADFGFITFKKLNCKYIQNSIPDSKTKAVNFDEFIKPSIMQLPFFIFNQLGTTPKITNEMRNALEGQTVAVLKKSQMLGHEEILEICEVKQGRFITIKRFENKDEDYLTNEPRIICK